MTITYEVIKVGRSTDLSTKKISLCHFKNLFLNNEDEMEVLKF